MPSPGEVFCHKQFEFDDGSLRDKWFVVLNNADLDKPCLALKTTSVPDRYIGSIKGCNPGLKVFFTPMAWQSCFIADTYIQLPQIWEFATTDLVKGGFANYIEFKSSLSKECFAQLKNCLAKFKDDISPRNWNLIYKSPS